MDYSTKFKEIRQKLNFSQNDFANILGISFSSYRRIEASRVTTIQTSVLNILFFELNISPLYFFFNVQPLYSNQISNLDLNQLQTQIIMHKLQSKITNINEFNFVDILLQTSLDQYHILLKGLKNIPDGPKNPKEAKELLINAIKKCPIGIQDLNLHVFTTERSKNKLLNFVEGLEEIECYVILHNIPKIEKIIQEARESNFFFFTK